MQLPGSDTTQYLARVQLLCCWTARCMSKVSGWGTPARLCAQQECCLAAHLLHKGVDFCCMHSCTAARSLRVSSCAAAALLGIALYKQSTWLRCLSRALCLLRALPGHSAAEYSP